MSLLSEWSEERDFQGIASDVPNFTSTPVFDGCGSECEEAPQFSGVSQIIYSYPIFDWDIVENIVSYQLIISHSNDFSDNNIVIQNIMDDDLENTPGFQFSLTDSNILEGMNYCKVRSKNNLGIYSEYTDGDITFVAESPYVPENIVNGTGECSDDYACPEDGAILDSISQLYWVALLGASEYEIMVDDYIGTNIFTAQIDDNGTNWTQTFNLDIYLILLFFL